MRGAFSAQLPHREAPARNRPSTSSDSTQTPQQPSPALLRLRRAVCAGLLAVSGAPSLSARVVHAIALALVCGRGVAIPPEIDEPRDEEHRRYGRADLPLRHHRNTHHRLAPPFGCPYDRWPVYVSSLLRRNDDVAGQEWNMSELVLYDDVPSVCSMAVVPT